MTQIKASNFISERFNSFHNFMTPSSLLFISTTILGTSITLSRTNWLFLWIGIELNLLSFIPIIANTNTLQETEGTVKYFIIQAVGRAIILTAGIISINPLLSLSLAPITHTIFIIRIAIKSGAAPCHQWFPHVISRIPWIKCLILITWQKIRPIFLLIIITSINKSFILSIIIIIGTIIGGIGGINQTRIRPLIAYSSIGHIRWILASIHISINLFFIYFIVYITITTTIIITLLKIKHLSTKINSYMININNNSLLILILIILSLGGLPPLLGFIPKWIIICCITNKTLLFILIFLITGRLLNLFFYLNICFNFILIKTSTKTYKPVPATILIITFISTISTLIIIL